jgi:hypothetical protein
LAHGYFELAGFEVDLLTDLRPGVVASISSVGKFFGENPHPFG